MRGPWALSFCVFARCVQVRFMPNGDITGVINLSFDICRSKSLRLDKVYVYPVSYQGPYQYIVLDNTMLQANLQKSAPNKYRDRDHAVSEINCTLCVLLTNH